MELTRDYSLNLRDFASGNFYKSAVALKESEEYAEKCFAGINIVTRKSNYDTEELKEGIINAVENKGSKLIIIDHLDFIDKLEKETDNGHVLNLMKTIRNVQSAFKVAVVAVSHLRKPVYSKESVIIPSMDEFYGSKSKCDIATAVVVLAPDDSENMNYSVRSLRFTWCCVRKLRMGGIDNLAARLVFDCQTGKYAEEYQLYKVNYSGTKAELFETPKKEPEQKKIY